MKLTINKAAFVAALASAARVVEPKNTIPILANVKLTAAAGVLSIMGTDLDNELQRYLPADIITEGAATVPAQLLLKLARKVPGDGALTLELVPVAKDESKLRISSGRTSFELATLPVEDFPKMESKLPWQAQFTLPAALLRDALTQVAPSMSTEESRFYLNGILLEYAPEGLRMVATDGHRLTCKTLCALDTVLPKPRVHADEVIVQSRTVAELQKLLNHKETADILVRTNAGKVEFTGPGWVLLAKVVDGTFPDYRRAVPAAYPYGVTLRRDELVEGIDLVSAVSEDRTCAVALTVYDETVTLRVVNPEYGAAAHTIARLAGAMPPKPFEVGFNARYLTTIAKLVSGETLDLHFTDLPQHAGVGADPGSPGKVTDPADESVFYICMPMRV